MSGVIPWIAPLVVFLAVAWLALLVAAPWLPVIATALTYAFGSLICHQIPERSFYLGTIQLPVCARCLGIYAGFAAAASLTILRHPVPGSDPTSRGLTPRQILIAGAMPTAVTWLVEWAGVWQTSNAERAVAGAPLGIAVGVMVIGALATVHYGECASRPSIAPDRPPTHI